MATEKNDPQDATISGAASTHAAIDNQRQEWRVIGETVPGASHLRAGIPNQDAILQMRESSVSLPLILSISDGHGSDKCFRSDRGSRFAVTIGAGLMRKLINPKRSDYDAAKLEAQARTWLPTEFVRRWNAAVEADLQREPLLKEELDRLEAKDGARARATVEAQQSLAYGATTLTVALTEAFVIYLQLGDGEIITVADTGAVASPLPEDERLLANETTSLCSRQAERDFRFAYQPLTAPLPALILLTTDGYANSFADDAGFFKVGTDILEMLRTEGFDAVNRSVQDWLAEATRMGSGDDCTLGIMVRMDALNRPASATSAASGDEAQIPAASPPINPAGEVAGALVDETVAVKE